MSKAKTKQQTPSEVLARAEQFRRELQQPSSKGRDEATSAAIMAQIEGGLPVVVRSTQIGYLKLNGQKYLKGDQVILDPNMPRLTQLIGQGYFMLPGEQALPEKKGQKDFYYEAVEPEEIRLRVLMTEQAKAKHELEGAQQALRKAQDKHDMIASNVEACNARLAELMAGVVD